MIRRSAAGVAAALALIVLPASPATAQVELPFGPLGTSAECTTGEPRDVDVATAGQFHTVATTRDKVMAGHQGRALNARALGRSLHRRDAAALPLGGVVDGAGNRYAAAETKDGAALFRASDGRHPRVQVLQVDPGEDGGTGDAAWLPILDVDVTQLDRAALTSHATTWPRVGDLVVDGDRLYVAIPDEHRVLAVSLDDGKDRYGRDRATVWSFVEADVNAPWAFAPPTGEDSFTFPTQLAVADGHLFIAEGHDGDAALRSRGVDLWAAAPGEPAQPSPAVGRLASLEDCDAEVIGIDAGPNGTIYLRLARTHFFFGLALKN